MAQPTAVHFGAGNIGRGFIAPLLAQSGYHVLFADVDSHLVDEINHHDSYDLHILDIQDEHIHVSGVSAVLSPDAISHVADPAVTLLTTAVGASILAKIAPTIAQGLQARRAAGHGVLLNVIACENMINQTAHLAEKVKTHLSDEDKLWVEQHVGFANCSVDRIVPPPDPSDTDPLQVDVEPFYEWIVDSSLLKGSIHPLVEGMKLTDSLGGYIERKLFTLNTGHAITAYLGYLAHHPTIDSAISDDRIRDVVCAALIHESGAALIKKHGFKPEEHEQYVHRVVDRFRNPRLKDEVIRVGRQPLRKLGREDRLVGPAIMASEYGISVDNLAKGIAGALLFDVPNDEESVQLQQKIKEGGIEKVVEEVTGFKEGSGEHKRVVEEYHGLSKSSK